MLARVTLGILKAKPKYNGKLKLYSVYGILNVPERKVFISSTSRPLLKRIETYQRTVKGIRKSADNYKQQRNYPLYIDMAKEDSVFEYFVIMQVESKSYNPNMVKQLEREQALRFGKVYELYNDNISVNSVSKNKYIEGKHYRTTFYNDSTE